MNIEMGKKYQTRDGKPVRVLCVDAPDKQPVVALVGDENPMVTWHNADGRFYKMHGQSNFDLIPVPEKVKVDCWLNFYPAGPGCGFSTEPEAKAHVIPGIIARLHIQREVEIGEGLTDQERARLKV